MDPERKSQERKNIPTEKENKNEKKEKSEREQKIDQEIEQSFPASDPPSYSQPGNDKGED